MSNGENVKPPRKPYWDRPENRPAGDGEVADPQPRDIAAIRTAIDEAKKSRNAKVKSAYDKKRFQSPATPVIAQSPAPTVPSTEPERVFRRDGQDWVERERALTNLKFEGGKRKDRLSKARSERIQRMRSPNERRGEKRHTPDVLHASPEARADLSERVRRINILLRVGVYDGTDISRLPEMVPVTRRDSSPDDLTKVVDAEVIVPRKDIEEWFSSLTSYEKKRLYVLGRKKIDFKFNEEEFLRDYLKRSPKYTIEASDSEEEKIRKRAHLDGAMRDAKQFQKEQKELADALEFVAIPMLEAVFKSLGKNVEVYLTSANDDIAGGLDIAIELKKRDGSPHRFHGNGMPMRFVIDMTYARMREKLDKDVKRGRVSQEAFDILKGSNRTVPPPLSNARAMKLFRSMVETMGGNMSTMTFGKRGPLPQPQEHVPRLILGLDWESAFSEIGNWVEEGDSFGENFKDTPMARRITQSIESQLKGLYAIASRGKDNPNTEYLAQILRTMDFSVDRAKGIAGDKSLENIDRLLSADEEALDASLRKRLYDAALAQVEHDKKKGSRKRGDSFETVVSQDPTSQALPSESAEAAFRARLVSPRAPAISTSVSVEPSRGEDRVERIRRMEEELEILRERERILELEQQLRDIRSKKK